ncbi:hypothetical protein PVAP13_4NG023181 [Panicum virgatum]|uniref:Uncharacterized protein n=1 Tax=Panicum virgatum TaxID=38727 RepID=A0A8T0T419_PANVG|nr:hypothetical protein PVAP13_4NG023181 [Panicum virgatum]
MRTGVVRLLVAVLDANAVPTDADNMVNRNMYRIFFKVDEILRDEEDFNPDDDDLLGEEEDRAADQDMKEADDSSDGDDKAEREVHEPHTINDSREMSSHKQAALEQDAIDISGVQLFDEASIKNLNETNDGSPSLVEGTLEDIGTVADRDTTSMAKMGVVTKAVVGAASEIELAVTAGSVAASEVVMADINAVTSTEPVAMGGQLEQEMLAAPPPTGVGGVMLSTEAESQLEQGAITASATEAASSQLPLTEINAGTIKTSKKIKKHAPATNTTLRRSNPKAARMAATRNLEGCFQGGLLVALMGTAAA